MDHRVPGPGAHPSQVNVSNVSSVNAEEKFPNTRVPMRIRTHNRFLVTLTFTKTCTCSARVPGQKLQFSLTFELRPELLYVQALQVVDPSRTRGPFGQK